MKPSLFFSFLLSAGACFSLSAAEWPITRNGFEIVISENASPSERFAAEELQNYLAKQSGQEIAIRSGNATEGQRSIVIGRHPQSEDLWKGLNNPDHYTIDATDERIRIVGGYRPPVTDSQERIWPNDWGILHAAYQLLDEQGVRWFRPGPEGEHIPKREKLVVENGTRRIVPPLEIRWGIAPFTTSAFKRTTDEERRAAALWSLRNGANSNLGDTDPKYGGSWRINGGHSYQYIVPQSLFAEHPDYFALINGERIPDKQICHSNPALQDHFVKQVKDRLTANPQLKMLSIDPNDHGGWCECDGCKAWDDPKSLSGRGGGRLSMSNRVYRFNKIIAERVGEEYPDVTLYCLAYSQYTEAPTIVQDFPKNLRVGITPFHTAFSDWSRALKDPESLQNRRVMESIEGFRKVGLGMYAREYFSFYDYYGWPGPLPMLRMMQDRLRVYRDEGMAGICSETHPCWGPQGMDLYMALRLINNPDLDLKQELTDYCRDYYGPAAKTMQRYHELIEARGSEGIYYGSGGVSAQNLFTDDFLKKLHPLVEQATREAKESVPYAKRTDAVLAGYRLARLYRDTRNALEAGKLQEAKASLQKLDHLLCDEYPDGTVFLKGLGRSRKDKEGKLIPSRVISVLAAELKRAGKIENQFKGAKIAQVLNEGWRFQPDANDEGRKREWQSTSFDDSAWAKVRAGLPWQDQGFTNHHGSAWYRRAFAGPVPAADERILLVFEAADGDAEIWLNGEPIGQHRLYDEHDNLQWDEPFHFDVTRQIKAGEPNQITVRMHKETGSGGLHRSVKLLRVPVGALTK